MVLHAVGYLPEQGLHPVHIERIVDDGVTAAFLIREESGERPAERTHPVPREYLSDALPGAPDEIPLHQRYRLVHQVQSRSGGDPAHVPETQRRQYRGQLVLGCPVIFRKEGLRVQQVHVVPLQSQSVPRIGAPVYPQFRKEIPGEHVESCPPILRQIILQSPAPLLGGKALYHQQTVVSLVPSDILVGVQDRPEIRVVTSLLAAQLGEVRRTSVREIVAGSLYVTFDVLDMCQTFVQRLPGDLFDGHQTNLTAVP